MKRECKQWSFPITRSNRLNSPISFNESRFYESFCAWNPPVAQIVAYLLQLCNKESAFPVLLYRPVTESFCHFIPTSQRILHNEEESRHFEAYGVAWFSPETNRTYPWTSSHHANLFVEIMAAPENACLHCQWMMAERVCLCVMMIVVFVWGWIISFLFSRRWRFYIWLRFFTINLR